MTTDHEAIRNLLARYCHHVDAAETEEWLGLYTDNPTLDLGMGAGPMTGHDALREMSARRVAGSALHLSANAVIDVKGDEADVASYVVVIGNNDDPTIRLGGRYVDKLRRVDGEWRFESRSLTPNFVKRV
jgi:SnoaL-like domain